MCLVVLAWNAHPQWQLVLAANRDEFHDRPAAPLGWWPDVPDVLAGRDLRGGGTWLGVSRSGRWGVVTNRRDLDSPAPAGAPSRGELVTGFVKGETTPEAYTTDLHARSGRYAGFNLLLGDATGLQYLNNGAGGGARRLAPGIHALGNERLDEPAPKLDRTRAGLARLLQRAGFAADALFELMYDREPDAHAAVAASGWQRLPLELQRALSAPFVVDERYGTRCSTVLLVDRDGGVLVHERRFDPLGEAVGETVERFALADTREASRALSDAGAIDAGRRASLVPPG